jgi:20S proteasome alpha/beta subunit
MVQKKISREEKYFRNLFFPKLKVSKELEFMRKLNKQMEEEYKLWLLKKKRLEKISIGTLIIATQGKNGIVVGSDEKVIWGGGAEADYQKKIEIFNIGSEEKPVEICFAAAGYLGAVDDFLEIFKNTLKENLKAGSVANLLGIKFIAEDLLLECEKRYAPRLGEPPLQFILGGLTGLTSGNARLYSIGSSGFGEKIRYYSMIGHGSPYARTIAKYLFNSEIINKLTLEEIAKRVAICIYWVGEEVDNWVGGTPQIVILRDGNAKFETFKINEEIKKKVEEIKNTLTSLSF